MNSGGKRSGIVDLELFCDWQRGDTLLPQILEVQLLCVESQGGRDEIAENSGVPNRLGLPITACLNLTLPRLSHSSSLGGVGTEFDHDTHLWVEDHSLRHNREDELLFFLGFLLSDRS